MKGVAVSQSLSDMNFYLLYAWGTKAMVPINPFVESTDHPTTVGDNAQRTQEIVEVDKIVETGATVAGVSAEDDINDEQ